MQGGCREEASLLMVEMSHFAAIGGTAFDG
jgi:hypothetical protein